jgi:hypothetical protein
MRILLVSGSLTRLINENEQDRAFEQASPLKTYNHTQKRGLHSSPLIKTYPLILQAPTQSTCGAWWLLDLDHQEAAASLTSQ